MENTKPGLAGLVETLTAALDRYEKSCTAYRGISLEAEGELRKIEKRQAAERRKVMEMVSALDVEEHELKQEIKAQTLAKGRAALAGKVKAETDNSKGARLAAIPIERAALQELLRNRKTTAAERKRWTACVSKLRDAAEEMTEASAAVAKARESLEEYMINTKYWSASQPRISVDDYIERGYNLNRDAIQSEV